MPETKYHWPIVGHENIVHFLEKSISHNKLAHAYIFYGPEHIGKTAVAENFVASLLCENDKEKPCHKCIHCQQLAKNIYPDVFRLEKDPEDKNIKIEQVRELQSQLSLTSFLNSYKIAIIKGAEDLSEEAADALLKTLEEPSQKTILILLSTSLYALPLTVISRCQAVKFLPVSDDKIFHHLVSLGATRQLADNLSHLAGGKAGMAINYFQNPELWKEYETRANNFFNIIEGGIIDRFQAVGELMPGKKDMAKTDLLVENLEIWQGILRDILLAKNNNLPFSQNIFFQEKIEKVSSRFDNLKLVQLINKIKDTERFISANVDPKLAVENLVMEM